MTDTPAAPGTPSRRLGKGTSNRDWWPEQLDLHLLHQHSAKSDPMGADFDYTAEQAGFRRNRQSIRLSSISGANTALQNLISRFLKKLMRPLSLTHWY